MKTKLRALALLCLALLLLPALAVGTARRVIPDTLSYFSDEGPEAGRLCSLTPEEDGGTATVMLLGILPVKTVELREYDRLLLCPGGGAFGLQAALGGVLVTAITPIDGRPSPAAEAGLLCGDLIVGAGSARVETAETLCRMIAESRGIALPLTVKRGEETLTLTLTPRLGSGGEYLAGMTVKDHAVGIGTITYVDAATGAFGGLGHGVYDGATGTLVPMLRGAVTGVELTGVVRGEVGEPGELRGRLTDVRLGTALLNTECGVFGVLTECPSASSAIPVGLRSSVRVGRAEILCTLDEGGCTRYTVEITSLRGARGNDKSFSIRVTDPRLLEKTGGIVQGMSGSPIIQNGKLVGAVTHVMVSDPTMGYGIYIENMLAASQAPMAKAS